MSILRVDYTKHDAAERFEQSLHAIGFAVLVNHPLQSELLQRLSENWLAFFESDSKQRYTANACEAGDQAGYFPLDMAEQAVGARTPDFKEYFHHFPGTPLPQELRDDVDQYRHQALALGRELLAWIAASAPQPVKEKLSDGQCWLSDSQSLLRILHYPPLGADTAPQALRAAAHQDINMLTILPVAEQPGLQVLNKSNRWIDLASERSALIINTGDMLAEVSGNSYPSTRHRVINPDIERNVSRLSLPFFLTPDLDVRLSERYSAGSYLAERLTELHQHQEGKP